MEAAMNKTQIEWCDRSWNPITGCPKPLVSPGCANCYARRTAETRLRGRCGYDAADPFKMTFHPDRMNEPSGYRQAQRIFVGSMGDMFHESVQKQAKSKKRRIPSYNEIKLKGELDLELTGLGLKAGDIIRNASYCKSNKAMYFNVFYVISNECVVYPENYEIIEMREGERNKVQTI